MPKLVKQLSLLLALQLLLAGAFLAYDYRTEQRLQNPEPLLAFETDRVDEIEIAEGDSRLLLKRVGSDWRVSRATQAAQAEQKGGEGDLSWPASKSQVQDLLTGLAELTRGWPVSSSSEGQQRLEVDDDSPQRRLILKGEGAPLAQVLLGTSPGSGRTHLRVAGESDVYLGEFAHHRASSDPQQWLDRGLLKVSSPVQAVRLPGFELSKGEDGWTAPEQPERKLDQSAVESLLNTLTQASVERVVEQSEPHGASYIVELDTEAETYVYTFWLDEDQARVRRGDRTLTFQVPRSLYDGLKDLKLETLEAQEEPDSSSENPDSEASEGGV